MTDHGDDRATAPNKPVDVIRDANLKASIWRNEGDDGPFYATSFARTYRDEQGEYRDAHSFVAADLLKLSELARKAYDRTNELRREDRAPEPESEPDSEARRAAFKERRGRRSEADRGQNRSQR